MVSLYVYYLAKADEHIYISDDINQSNNISFLIFHVALTKTTGYYFESNERTLGCEVKETLNECNVLVLVQRTALRPPASLFP
jgi:hypothetical protein